MTSDPVAEWARRYRLAVADLWQHVQGLLRARWDVLDWTDIDASFRAFLDDRGGAVDLVTAGQSVAQNLAAAFVTQYVSLQTGEPFTPAAVDPNVIGSTRDGSPLRDALWAMGPAMAFATLGKGMPMQVAMASGGSGLEKGVAQAIADAAWEETAHQTAESDALSGWTWVTTSGNPCDFCQEMEDGRTRKPDTPLTSHPSCACQGEPVLYQPRGGFTVAAA